MLERSGFDELFREVSYIYSFLGLRQNLVLDKLEIMSSEDRDHQSLCDWIVTFVQNSFESVSLTDKRSPSAELLSSIGFDHRSSAAETIMARAREIRNIISICAKCQKFSSETSLKIKFLHLLWLLSSPFEEIKKIRGFDCLYLPLMLKSLEVQSVTSA